MPEKLLRFSLPLRALAAQGNLESPTYASVSLTAVQTFRDVIPGGLSAASFETLFNGKLTDLPEVLALSSEYKYGEAEWTLEITLWGGSDTAACNYGQFKAEGKRDASSSDPILLRTGNAPAGSDAHIVKLVVPAQSGAGSLAGTIKDARGQAIPGAKIQVAPKDGGFDGPRFEDAADVGYFMDYLSTGVPLSVTASAEGYQPQTKLLTLVEEKDRNCRNETQNRLDFVLKPNP